MAPELSVVMPVRNAMPHLDASLASILGQTFGDFEFVIRDEASTDGSREVLRAWAARDARVRLTEGDEVLGPSGSSNWVVRESRAPLVARMDADDVAHADRLRRQVEILRAHPDVVLVGALWESIDEAGRVVRGRDRGRLARCSGFAPFPHPSIAFRREPFVHAGGYRSECEFWEDVDLYLRMAEHGQIAVLPAPLLRVRHSRAGVRLLARDRVEEAYDRMFRRVAALPPRDGLLPQAIVSVASVELWAGGRPRILGRLRRRARLGPDAVSAAAVAWALAASVMPGLLRRALRILNRVRDLRAARWIRDGAVYEWAPDRPPRELA